MPYRPEGMPAVEDFKEGAKVVRLRLLEGAVHLIPIELIRKWIVNNRIDYHTWEALNDGE